MYLYDLMFFWVLFVELIKAITRWDSFSVMVCCIMHGYRMKKHIQAPIINNSAVESVNVCTSQFFLFFSNAKAGQGCLKRAF